MPAKPIFTKQSSTCCGTDNGTPTLHVVIIGSGSAAFSCALKVLERASDAQAMKVTIIEGAKNIGGCCVNVGCVPSKILIRAAQLAEQQRNNPFIGLKNNPPKIDRALLNQQQSARVEELRLAKYENILSSNPAITLVKGWATFTATDAHTVTLTIKPTTADNNTEQLELIADKVLIATGSTATIPEISGLANTPYWTSTEALFTSTQVKQLVVIGSSVIALELAQAYSRLGTQVTIIARHHLLYKQEPLLGETLQSLLEQEGIIVITNTLVEQISHANHRFSLTLNNDEQLECDQLLISTGRHANTEALNLSAVNVATNQQGKIIVDDHLATPNPNIYAAGDCSTLPQYVYVAAAAGSRAAINMIGGDATLDLSAMPAVIFTDPQVATVGLTEAQAQQQGIEAISRVLLMENVPRALANFATNGFIKLVAEQASGKLLGAQILAHDAGEIIQSAALAIHNNMTVEELAGQLFPYLTMVEGLKLCAQTFNKDVSALSCCAG